MWYDLHTFGVVHMFPKNVQLLWVYFEVMKLHTFDVVNMFPKNVQLQCGMRWQWSCILLVWYIRSLKMCNFYCIQICAKSPKNEAYTIRVGSIMNLHTNLCKIFQKWGKYHRGRVNYELAHKSVQNLPKLRQITSGLDHLWPRTKIGP